MDDPTQPPRFDRFLFMGGQWFLYDRLHGVFFDHRAGKWVNYYDL